MLQWKRSAQIPTHLSRRKTVRLNLESLEARELLDAGLLNALPPSSTNPAPVNGSTSSGLRSQAPIPPPATAHTPPDMISDGSNLCNCGCPNQSGDLLQAAPAASGPAIRASTPDPVRYADGVVTLAETDLHSDGFGFPWGQTRSWTNGQGYATSSDNGNGWVDTYTPHLMQSGTTIIFLANGNTASYYDLVNGVYQPRINDGSHLSYNSGNDTYTLTDTLGDQIVLDGFGTSWLTRSEGSVCQLHRSQR